VTPAAKPAGAACATCPARLGKCVLPEPAPNGARLAVVGEAPGRNELEQGRPFIGASGRMLGRGLQSIGLRRADVHWTNAILCECKEDDMPAARKACAPRLRAELAAVGAPVIMPVGSYGLHSAMALTKKPAILKWRGSVSEAVIEGGNGVTASAYVTPTIHPAFVMRAPKWGPVLEIDVARVGRLLALHARGERWVPPECAPGRRTVIARTEETLGTTLESLGKEVGNDVETVGLGPTETLLVCLALSDGTTTVVIPWSRGRDGREPWWSFPDRIARMLTGALRHRVSVTHNGPAFDHIVEDRYGILDLEERYGIHIEEWDDTLLAAHVMTSHLPKNLAQVVTTYLDVPPWKQLEDRTADLERLWTYNARDTLYTILAWQHAKQELREAA
jgi:uracil-DNA glycosylase